MANWLNKLLNVRPGEWTRLLLLSAIIIVINIGMNLGLTVAYAAFLKQTGLSAGLETLVWVLLLTSLLSVPVLSIYAILVDRMDSNRLFAYIVLLDALVVLFGLGLLSANLQVVAFPLLYVLSTAVSSAFNSQFFTYINEVYDIQTAKRALPLILGTGRIGAALAGFTQQSLTGWLGTQGILWLWLLTDTLVIGIILVIPFILKGHIRTSGHAVRHKPSELDQKNKSTYWHTLLEGLNFTRQSVFLRWLAVGTLLLAAVLTLMEYHINQILSPQFATQAEFAGFLGKINAISNLTALAILLFGLSRVTKAWGIADSSLIFPVGNLFICVWMFLFPGIWSASIATIDRKGLRFSLQMPIEAQLYNAIPLRIKGRARAFVGGLVSPVGGIIGVLLLLMGQWNKWPMLQLLPVIIIVLAILYLLSTLAIRYQYTQALVKMLEEEDYTFLLNEGASELVVVDPAALQRLQKKLEESTSHEMRVFMTQLIAQVGGAESLSLIIPVIKTTSDPRTRAAMLNVVSAASLGGEKIHELYIELLSDNDAQVRQAAAAGLEQLLGAKNAWLQEVLLGMVNDADTRVSLYALQLLANSGEFYRFDAAVQKLHQFLVGDSIEHKKDALNILGKLHETQAVEQMFAFLKEENDLLRLETVLQLENLALSSETVLAAKVLEKTRPLSSDPVARIRQAVIKIMGKVNQKADYPFLLSALADKNLAVRSTAVDTLVEIGKEVVPTVQAALDSPDVQLHKMATVVLSRIHPRQFASLIETEVFDSLGKVYHNINLEPALTAYEQYSSVRLLLFALREINQELIEDGLYLLSAIHPRETIAVIHESLHSDSAGTRNLALEALESLTSPRSAALIASLFESSMTPAQLVQLGQDNWQIEEMNIVQVFERLLSQTESKILSLLALYALRDIVVGLPRPKRTSRRSARLLQMLQTPDDQGEAAPDLMPALKSLMEESVNHPDEPVRLMVQGVLQKLAWPESDSFDASAPEEDVMPLSTIDRMIVMKEVPFFRNIPIGQLEMLAVVCEEKRYTKGEFVFQKSDSGGILYIVVEGEIGIQQEKRGGSALLATVKKSSYFGEVTFFDNTPQTNSAVATADSLVLQLQRGPIINLTTQNPELALELINVLSQRMREASDRLADTARSRPRELHKLYDQFEY